MLHEGATRWWSAGAACCLFAALQLGGCSGSSAGPGAANGDSNSGPDSTLGTHVVARGSIEEGDSCVEPGATYVCCDVGVRTCNNAQEEFALWGPCLDTHGTHLVCHSSENCGEDEFSSCDAGAPLDAGYACDDGEFGPTCTRRDDGGLPPPPSLCTDRTINNEPEILAAYSPASGASVSAHGQIKVWVTDEHAAFTAPGEQLDPNTGVVTMAGDRTAKAKDGYLYEPALYIAPASAENGGTPYFPTAIKGAYNNTPTAKGKRMALVGAPIDPPPAGTDLGERFDTEDVWNVSDLGLSPGTYIAEFMIHDGDEDRGVGCVTIVVTP